MDRYEKDEFERFIQKESKEYVCPDCGTYSLRAMGRKYISHIEAEVTLECERCKYKKVALMLKFD